MPLQTSSFPIPETRFFKAGSCTFKFKIRGGTSYSREEAIEDDGFNQVMEDIVRTVLGNLDNLQPFYTNDFIIFPYKKPKKAKSKSKMYPYTIVLFVEKNTRKERPTGEPRPKRRWRDSPLEEAILHDLVKDMEAERSVTDQMRPSPSKVDKDHQDGKEEDETGLPVEEETKKLQDEGDQEVRPGILKRMARHILPFLFKHP